MSLLEMFTGTAENLGPGIKDNTNLSQEEPSLDSSTSTDMQNGVTHSQDKIQESEAEWGLWKQREYNDGKQLRNSDHYSVIERGYPLMFMSLFLVEITPKIIEWNGKHLLSSQSILDFNME